MADFLSSLQSFESGDYRHPDRGGSNIANTRQGTSSGQAQGFNQITTGTWKEFGGLAYAPTPLQATQEQQNAIAAKIPLKRWAPETLAYLRNNGFTLNPNATLAENIAANHGTVGTAPPPHSTTPGTTINTSGGPTAPSGAPGSPASAPPAVAGTGGAPAAGTTLPGFQPGSPANKMAQNALKTLGGGGGGGGDEPQPPPLQMAQSQAVGGPMMMRPGGMNAVDPRIIAQQALQQQGYMTQPTLAANIPFAPQPVVPSTIQSTIQPMAPGGATGMGTGLPGTTLNSPSQLQMALMSGALSPYDMYARNVGSM